MILVIMGVSGTGKSSVGKYISDKLGWTLYEGDEYHPKENIEKMSRGEPLTDQINAREDKVMPSLAVGNRFNTAAGIAHQFSAEQGTSGGGSVMVWRMFSAAGVGPACNTATCTDTGEVDVLSDDTGEVAVLQSMLDRELSSGANGIVICSALKKSYRHMLLFGSTPQPEACQHETVDSVCFAFLHGDFQLIHQRLLARRDHFMSADLLRSQFDALEPPTDVENAFAVDIKKSIPEVSSQIERIISARLQT